MNKIAYVILIFLIIFTIKNDFFSKDLENFENTISVTAPDDLNSVNVLSQLSTKLISNNGIIFPGSISFVGNVLNKGKLDISGNITSSGTITATNATFDTLNILPKGLIIIWYSTSAGVINAPSGWAICDGTNGTPDLRGKFILGAGGIYTHGSTGGSETVKLKQRNLPPHKHLTSGNLFGSTYLSLLQTRKVHKEADKPSGLGIINDNFILTDNGASLNEDPEPIKIVPPYIALFYIIKL